MDFVTFYKKYRELIDSAPRYPNNSKKNENSPYGDYIFGCLNMYFGFEAVECRDSFYLYDSFKVQSSADCSYAVDSELCHESIDIFRCYKCDYMNHCDVCVDCSYCRECSNCQNCFGCVYLKNKHFCFFNQQLEESEYRRKVKEYENKKPEEVLQQVGELFSRFPERTSRENGNENCSFGNYYYNNTGSYYLFDAAGNEDCAYLYDSHYNKNSFDQTYCARNELCYELVESINCYKSFFSQNLERCISCYFSLDLDNCTDCFGCAFLNKKQYCILNKQYTPEEYKQQVKMIVDSIKSGPVEHLTKAVLGF
ncbi:MAG: hypothetical protein WC797_03195 [Candidatus Paceibacterota bacterium]|jgi:hypothetical protein